MNTTLINIILTSTIPVGMVLGIVKLYIRNTQYHEEISIFGYPRTLALTNGCEWGCPDEIRDRLGLNILRDEGVRETIINKFYIESSMFEIMLSGL